jgi:hypothetical protein
LNNIVGMRGSWPSWGHFLWLSLLISYAAIGVLTTGLPSTGNLSLLRIDAWNVSSVNPVSQSSIWQ